MSTCFENPVTVALMDLYQLGKLFESFDELESAIDRARRRFKAQGICGRELYDRIQTYEEILEKQRMLATEIAAHLSLKNWPEVARKVRIISALSAMIRDDAKRILIDGTDVCGTVTFERREPAQLH